MDARIQRRTAPTAGERRLRRWVPGVRNILQACLVLTLAASEAGAETSTRDQLRVVVSAAPQELRVAGRPQHAEYELRITAGAQDQRFALQVSPPRFPGEGALFEGPSIFRLEGAGRTGYSIVDNVIPACTPSFRAIHGVELQSRTVDLTVPANTQSVLRVRFPVATHDAPWVNTDLRPKFTVTPKLVEPVEDGPTTISAPFALQVPRPRVIGPRGVEIRLATTPVTEPFLSASPPSFTRRQVFRVSGTTSPPLRRQVMRLRAVTPTSKGQLATVARVRTDTRGRFVYRWRPRRKGTYQLSAFYRSQQRGLADDRTCPRSFRLR